MGRALGTLVQAPVLWMGTGESQGLAKAAQPVKLQSQGPLPGSPFLWVPHFHGIPEYPGRKAAEVKAQM